LFVTCYDGVLMISDKIELYGAYNLRGGNIGNYLFNRNVDNFWLIRDELFLNFRAHEGDVDIFNIGMIKVAAGI